MDIDGIQQMLKKYGYCAIPLADMTLKDAKAFASVNNLLFSVQKAVDFDGPTDYYLFQVDSQRQAQETAEGREHQKRISQHVLFAILATILFTLLLFQF